MCAGCLFLLFHSTNGMLFLSFSLKASYSWGDALVQIIKSLQWVVLSCFSRVSHIGSALFWHPVWDSAAGNHLQIAFSQHFPLGPSLSVNSWAGAILNGTSMLSFTKEKTPSPRVFWGSVWFPDQELFVASWYVATCCWNPILAGLQEQVFPVVFVTDTEHYVLMLDTLPTAPHEPLSTSFSFCVS